MSIPPSYGNETITATAKLNTADGKGAGSVRLVELHDRVLLQVDIKGITPGTHGFHIHETASCSDNFKAAGGHFNPFDKGHGFAGNGSHAGDLSNIIADTNGIVKTDVFAQAVTLKEGLINSLMDNDGSAIVVHEKADTYGDAAGAGSRVACGIIKKVS
ncbi:hypothetical protein WH96_05630 [Kiloniella spongiae]|uniref:Superoxide dismutase copper/zinc binding domain-containing protein n=1 Tax=Kiloniella spongiae TaxID=1489064 RepID=A0A0H2MII7_9PROT|nr:hypothetical protein WH96_05630 [Kiloniella spongiae]